ncbi:MAG: hypothetical protein JXA67_16550, partial [Micromonosporaceae bacterium]|nr:hypothetical protein [Micromonosporaceae bacterium]
DRKGCEIHWFDDAGFQIRVKSSSAYTYRAPRCEGCPLYCQEGFYSLKHSVQGWVTGCPTGLADRGTHLAADLSDDGALRRLAPLVEQLLATRRVDDSHQRFLAHHRLAPPTTARVPASETGHR